MRAGFTSRKIMDTWSWLHYVVIGAYAYTTILMSWLRSDIKALWEAWKDIHKTVTNEQTHEIQELRERIQRLEDKNGS